MGACLQVLLKAVEELRHGGARPPQPPTKQQEQQQQRQPPSDAARRPAAVAGREQVKKTSLKLKLVGLMMSVASAHIRRCHVSSSACRRCWCLGLARSTGRTRTAR